IEFKFIERLIELVTTIMVYKFEKLSRIEVEQMLGITLKETKVYREIKQEGHEEGQEEGREATANIIIRLLTKRFGKLSDEIHSSISSLSIPMLENLSETLLDFTSVNDLQVWLENQRS
ncbi:MAG: DUF4351 domain-containing protein, partial [Waterburya sp.]